MNEHSDSVRMLQGQEIRLWDILGGYWRGEPTVYTSSARKDSRSAAERARDTAGTIGSLKHESYVPTREAEAIHRHAARGEITEYELIEIFRPRALQMQVEASARERPT